MSLSPPRFLVRRRLIAVAVGLPVVETALLWAFGLETALGIAPQASAPAPFDVFHDLRWLLVYHRSWLRLALGAAASIAFQPPFTVFMGRAAGREEKQAPPLRRTIARSAVFVATAAVLLSPWVALLFGMAIVSIS